MSASTIGAWFSTPFSSSLFSLFFRLLKANKLDFKGSHPNANDDIRCLGAVLKMLAAAVCVYPPVEDLQLLLLGNRDRDRDTNRDISHASSNEPPFVT